MLKFLQFINEADQAEGDFTYTTKQGKTDEHVKGFVKNVIKAPKIELSDNGVSITGRLEPKYNKYITVDVANKQIAATSDLSKQITAIVTQLIADMTDQSVVRIKATKTDGDAIPQSNKTNYTITINFEFDGDDFDGKVDVTLNCLMKTPDENVTLSQDDQCDIAINCSWHEA